MSPLRSELRVEFLAFTLIKPEVGTPSWMGVGRLPLAGHLTEHILARSVAGPVKNEVLRRYIPKLGGNVLTVLVTNSEQRASAMVVGPKVTEEPFANDEIGVLQTTAGQLATIVDKLELVDELREKSRELQELNRMLVEANEAERARIAAHLHDDPLQKITYVLWLCQDHNVPTEVVTYLHDVVSDLRNFTALLRPVELQDLGLARALEALVDEVEARSSFSADLRVTGLSRDGRLPDEIELGVTASCRKR